MRPSIGLELPGSYECAACGARVGSPESRTCAVCGGALLNLGAERDL